MKVSAIVAASHAGVIGNQGDLPWNLPADLKRFKVMTKGHVVVAGRKTYESILWRTGRPLPERTTLVLTSSSAPTYENVKYASSVTEATQIATKESLAKAREEYFVIGGSEIFKLFLPVIETVYLTLVDGVVHGDVTLPPDWLSSFSCVETERAIDGGASHVYSFQRYERTKV